ncbi:MAG: hypothetical protein IT530_04155 [Burkholderiales bacterium]|nr:hypothetical protein [Burkholderiales bacterium]
MGRFSAFEDGALLNRLKRLDRAEKDLQKKVTMRIWQLEADDRWVRTDPLFRQLSSTLAKVCNDMRETEAELLRRGSLVAAKKAA